MSTNKSGPETSAVPPAPKKRDPHDVWLEDKQRQLVQRLPFFGPFAKASARTDLPPSRRTRLGLDENLRLARQALAWWREHVNRQTAAAQPFWSADMWRDMRQSFGLFTALLAELLYVPLNGFAWLLHTILNIVTGGWTNTERSNGIRKTALHRGIRLLVLPLGYAEKGLRFLWAKIIDNLAATPEGEPIVGPIVGLAKRISRLFGSKKKSED